MSELESKLRKAGVGKTIRHARRNWHPDRRYGLFIGDDGLHFCQEDRPRFEELEQSCELVGVYTLGAYVDQITEDVLCAMQ